MRARRNVLLVTLLVALAAVPLLAGKKNKKKMKEAATASPSAEVVASVDGAPISLEQIDAEILGRLAKVRQDEYDLRRSSLDRIIGEILLENEAKARGVSLEQLIETEVTAKAAQPTQQQIQQYYNANKARNRQIASRTLDEATPLIRQTLEQQQIAARRQQFISELRDRNDVRVMLEPPRAEVTIPAGAPSKGPEDAPIVLVEYSDYQCPYCKRAENTVEQILAEYGDKIRFVYLEFPLAFHQRAMPASVAALCAGEQDRYWEFHDNLLRINGNLSDEDLAQRARTLQLDMERFTACYDGNEFEAWVRSTMDAASALGVTGTPTFFLNGRMMVGAKPLDEFKKMIEEELALAEDRVGG